MKAKKSARRPVFMIGLDGLDWELVMDLISCGKLPTLAGMMDTGAWGRLDSPADAYAGGVWPDFYTGTPVSQHGIYHNKLWHQQRMRVEVPTDHWLDSRPFYENLGEEGLKICAIDIPMVLGEPKPVNGTYLGGWGTHDLISRGAWPKSLWNELTQHFGNPCMPVEGFGAQTAKTLLQLRKDLLAATHQIVAITTHLLQRQSPEFTCVVLGAGHRAGHYLWDSSQVYGPITSAQKTTIEQGLSDIYIACDQALEKLLAEAPKDSVKFAFAVHGMVTNHGWSDLGASLVNQILSASLGHQPKRGLLYQLRQSIPFHWVRPVLTRLPQWATAQLVKLWSARMYEWSSTPYFPMPMDQAGYVRINLKGRERDGIVEAGEPYDNLCEKLESIFLGIHDLVSGKPLVKKIKRAWLEAGPDAHARDLLPDLLIEWGDLSLVDTRELVCDGLPDFRFKVPHKAVSGRSGNHIGRGWFVAIGEGVQAGELVGYSIRDLAPTIYRLLDLKPPEHFTGSPIVFSEYGEQA